MNDSTCFFYSGFYNICSILSGQTCHGKRNGCTFYKTKKKYWKDRNETIKKCREKGLCAKCQYTEIKCEVIDCANDI